MHAGQAGSFWFDLEAELCVQGHRVDRAQRDGVDIANVRVVEGRAEERGGNASTAKIWMDDDVADVGEPRSVTDDSNAADHPIAGAGNNPCRRAALGLCTSLCGNVEIPVRALEELRNGFGIGGRWGTAQRDTLGRPKE